MPACLVKPGLFCEAKRFFFNSFSCSEKVSFANFSFLKKSLRQRRRRLRGGIYLAKEVGVGS